MKGQQSLKIQAVLFGFLAQLVPSLLRRRNSLLHHLLLHREGQPFLTVLVLRIEPDHAQVHKPVVLRTPMEAYNWVVRVSIEADGDIFVFVPSAFIARILRQVRDSIIEAEHDVADILKVFVVDDADLVDLGLRIVRAQNDLILADACTSNLS